MPHQWLAGLVAVSLWSLAMALDVLRMLGRRNQLRRVARVVASIPAEVNENPIAMFDITPLGAGFETNQELSARQQLLLDATITTGRGCEDVKLPIVVRHVRQVSEVRWRVGVEFADAVPQAVNPLIQYCMVEPARQRLGRPSVVPAREQGATVEAVIQPVVDGRRLTLRLISLMAVGGAIASAQPGNGTVVAWLVSAVSVLIAAGVLAGSARPRRAPWTVDQSTSSPHPTWRSGNQLLVPSSGSDTPSSRTRRRGRPRRGGRARERSRSRPPSRGTRPTVWRSGWCPTPVCTTPIANACRRPTGCWPGGAGRTAGPSPSPARRGAADRPTSCAGTAHSSPAPSALRRPCSSTTAARCAAHRRPSGRRRSCAASWNGSPRHGRPGARA